MRTRSRWASPFLALLLLSAHALQLAAASKVEHVVVLMLENRSFDHLLGFLKERDGRIEGCLPDSGLQCTCPEDPLNSTSARVPVSADAVYRQISDPQHSLRSTSKQVYGFGSTNITGPAPMTGFIKDYANGDLIMACFAPDHIPATTTLASEFAVFDHWHASIPGPTEVNRMYANSATSHGAGSNNPFRLAVGFPQRTIFDSLDDSVYNRTWGVYFSIFPTAVFLGNTRNHLDRFHAWDDFLKDAAAGKLPSYSWLEPSYFDILSIPATDQHPDHDVAAGDELIKQVYEAVRNGPLWEKTLLIITYDEHGGFFDHVPPPTNCPNPDDLYAYDVHPPFDFMRLGVRVPTIMASPWIPKNIVVGAPDVHSYEHASLPATVRKLFAPDQPLLTRRDAWAATFDHILSLDQPRTDCPTTLPSPPSHRLTSEQNGLLSLDKIGTRPLTEFQESMLEVASALNHKGAITQSGDGMAEGEAALYIAAEVNKFFHKDLVRF